MKIKKPNHGLNWWRELEEQSDLDWIFGAASPVCIAEIPNEEREKYLPEGEVQRGKEDFMDCTTRGPINLIETKFNFLLKKEKLNKENIKWLKDNNYITLTNKVEFSDRSIAILSRNTSQGNSMKAPLDFIHKGGLIPKSMFPASPTMTFDEYHDKSKITVEMIELGKKFLKRFKINYERVWEKNFEEMLKRDILDIGGYAWPEPINGVYPRSNEEPNHIFMGLKLPKYYIFDNYLDRGIEGDYIKKLASNYDFISYGYRIIISEIMDLTTDKIPLKMPCWWEIIFEPFKDLALKIWQVIIEFFKKVGNR